MNFTHKFDLTLTKTATANRQHRKLLIVRLSLLSTRAIKLKFTIKKKKKYSNLMMF